MSMNFPLRIPDFPNSYLQPFLATSPQTPRYNCIAWACEDSKRWYWPDKNKVYFWPKDVPREETVDAFIKLFEKLGYSKCGDGSFEKGLVKVAIFVDNNNKPTHAARQLITGQWTSKLGREFDIHHTIPSMENGKYGKAGQYLQKKI